LESGVVRKHLFSMRQLVDLRVQADQQAFDFVEKSSGLLAKEARLKREHVVNLDLSWFKTHVRKRSTLAENFDGVFDPLDPRGTTIAPIRGASVALFSHLDECPPDTRNLGSRVRLCGREGGGGGVSLKTKRWVNING
jgi:hypothetical protein